MVYTRSRNENPRNYVPETEPNVAENSVEQPTTNVNNPLPTEERLRRMEKDLEQVAELRKDMAEFMAAMRQNRPGPSQPAQGGEAPREPARSNRTRAGADSRRPHAQAGREREHARRVEREPEMSTTSITKSRPYARPRAEPSQQREHRDERAERSRGRQPPRSQCHTRNANNITLPLNYTSSGKEYGTENKDRLRTPKRVCTFPGLKIPLNKLTMEGVPKWDQKCSKTRSDSHCFYSSTVSTLQRKLKQARMRIFKLEYKYHSSRKSHNKMRKLLEEKNSRQIREHCKMCSVIHDLQEQLRRERKNRKKTESFSSKLVNELADARSTIKQLVQDYEEEKNARELTEEACCELATKVGEDRVKVETMKRETTRICKEMEEERRMLHLAEIWREERVHMKLVDAKLAVEDKYREMNRLVDELESLLMTKSENVHVELRKADLIKKEVNSLNVQDIEELSYVSPKTEDIFSSFRDVRQIEVNNPTKRFEVNDFNNDDVAMNSHGIISCKDGSMEHAEVCDGSETAGWNSPSTRIREVLCSIPVEQPKQKELCVSKVAQPSFPRNGEYFKRMSDENDRRRTKDQFSTMGTTYSPQRKSIENWFSQQHSMGSLVSPDSGNLHITRGIKGSVKWPRDTHRSCAKKKLLKDFTKSQRHQLSHVVK